MKSLVIGGTKGFGKEVSSELSERGYDNITVARSRADYSCDVTNKDKWRTTLKAIKADHDSLDFIACIVGGTEAKHKSQLTKQDWEKNLLKNLTYVATVFEELGAKLLSSEDPRAITIGSQWSYKLGNPYLLPYTIAKQYLRAFTGQIAENTPDLTINHYCMPAMDTSGYWRVRKSFKNIGKEEIIDEFGLTEPNVIAHSLVDHILKTRTSGETLVMGSEGEIQHLSEILEEKLLPSV
ncbi:MAG: SDR family oxidoreductase [Candidatus Woesearchaeota archaeon]